MVKVDVSNPCSAGLVPAVAYAYGERCKLCVPCIPVVIGETRQCIIASPSGPLLAYMVSMPTCLGHRHVQHVVVHVQDDLRGVIGVGPKS